METGSRAGLLISADSCRVTRRTSGTRTVVARPTAAKVASHRARRNSAVVPLVRQRPSVSAKTGAPDFRDATPRKRTFGVSIIGNTTACRTAIPHPKALRVSGAASSAGIRAAVP